MEKRVRKALQRASMSAVFPEPTGLVKSASCVVPIHSSRSGRGVISLSSDETLSGRGTELGPRWMDAQGKVTYPPMPMVNERSSQSLPSIMGISRPRKLPGPSRISCVCPWSPPPPWECECDASSCEWDIAIQTVRCSRVNKVVLSKRYDEVPWMCNKVKAVRWYAGS